jgi:mannose-1-phosphate guanylyltransferase
MEAVLLVGGQGTRLRPLTLTTPKPMLPVANHPCTAHQISKLMSVGVTRVILSTSYKAEVFEDYFGHGEDLGIEIEYVTEDSPLGTGGAIRNVADALRSRPDEPIIILNGDILTDHNLQKQIDFHRNNSADVTLHLRTVEDPRAFGLVVTDEQHRVSAFIEKPSSDAEIVTDQINAGCYIFNRKVIDEIPAGRVVSVERETFPGLLQEKRRVFGYVENNYWLDLGTPLAFVQGSRDMVQGECSTALVTVASQALTDESAEVDATAVITGGSAIGAEVVVGPTSQVEGSVIMAGAVIHAASQIRNSIIGFGAVINVDCQLDGAVVADGVIVAAGTNLVTGDLVFPDGSISRSI